MADLDISQLGKGALPDPQDPRDFKYESAFGASPVDFTKEFRLPSPPDENQNTSLSCVAQAASYLHWQLRKKNFTRRDVYAWIFLPDGGAYLRDGVKRIADIGQATRDEAADPKPQTEAGMRDRTGLTPEKSSSDKEANYFLITDGSIDGIARAVRDHNGCIFGVYGHNAGWKNKDNPTPPNSGQVEWAHALYAMGYHMHSGKKCIIAKSSWCTSTHHEHHIKEDYFIKGMTFNGWSIVPEGPEQMTNSVIVKAGNGEYGIYDPATSEDGLVTLMRNRGMAVPLTPENKLDWSKLVVTKGLVDIQ